MSKSGYGHIDEPHPMISEAWDNIRRSMVYFRGQPVGTITALDNSDEKLNYDQKRYDSDFVIHCKPNGLCEIVSALKGAQEEDVKAVGFGGMLRISGISVTKTDLIRWLVERFNGRTQMLTISNRAMMGRRTSLLVIFEKTCLDCISSRVLDYARSCSMFSKILYGASYL
ncbi:hypothetical protein CASFOL_013919 [Castilleja foliolosa]|uniref:Uncharacterized protein n=1 Tax=Castilleja foliolosa TaxID=1961234 RepID=A0ABD3DQA5_9LAMI